MTDRIQAVAEALAKVEDELGTRMQPSAEYRAAGLVAAYDALRALEQSVPPGQLHGGIADPLPARYGTRFVTWEELPEKFRLPYYAALSALDADARRPVSEEEIERLAAAAYHGINPIHARWEDAREQETWRGIVRAILEAAAPRRN